MTIERPLLRACVGPRLQARLCSLVSPIEFSRSLAELSDAIKGIESTVAFVDPATDERFAERIVQMRTECPTSTFVVYTVLEPPYFQDIVRLVEAGVHDVMLFGFDDHHRRLQTLLVDIAARQQFPAFMAAIEPHLMRLPPPLRTATEELLTHPARFRSSHDLARSAGMSTRAVFRHLNSAGFLSLRRLVMAAKVMLAYRLLKGQTRSVYDVADRLGYASSDQLSKHVAELVGCSASHLRWDLPPHNFFGAISRGLVRADVNEVSNESDVA